MWPIDRITVQDRARRDVGDLTELKASLTRLGQLQPVAARPDGVLVFGERRLTAMRELGEQEIAVRIWTDDSAENLLRAEQDENTCRLALTHIEASRLAKRLRDMLAPGPGKRTDLETSSESDKVPERTDRQAAKATGYSSDTIRKVDEVVKAAEDPNEPTEVREEAKRQIEENLSKPKGNPTAAKRAVDTTRRRVARKHEHELMPGQVLAQPPPPAPTFPLERRLVDGINKGQGLKALAGEVQDREDLDLTSDTIKALQQRLKDEAGERTQLRTALGSVLAKRKASSP